MLGRMRAVRMVVRHRRSSLRCRREDRTDQRQVQLVNLAGRERAPGIDPPVQYQNERADDVLRQQIGGNSWRAFLQRDGYCIDLATDSISQQRAEMSMYNGASPPARFQVRRVSTLAHVFK